LELGQVWRELEKCEKKRSRNVIEGHHTAIKPSGTEERYGMGQCIHVEPGSRKVNLKTSSDMMETTIVIPMREDKYGSH